MEGVQQNNIKKTRRGFNTTVALSAGSKIICKWGNEQGQKEWTYGGGEE